MTVKQMKEFVDATLSLHPSFPKVSRHLSPRVELERLSDKTIRKYYKPESYESSHGSPSKEEYPSDKSEDFNEKSEDEDTRSSWGSEDLPNLNDPSWCKEVKKVEGKKQKRKKKNKTQNSSGQLMKNARKVFRNQAIRYKSSQEFVKKSKAKEAQNTKSKLHSNHGSYQHIQSNMQDNRLYNMVSQSGSTLEASSHTKAVTVQTIEKKRNEDSMREGSIISSPEMLSLKIKENMAKFIGQENTNSVPEDFTSQEVQPLNTSAIPNVQFEGQQFTLIESDDSCHSNDSLRTVLFENDGMTDICAIESAHTVTDDADSIFADETSNTNKRKCSPLTIEEFPEMNKKLKEEIRQDIDKERESSTLPMVMIPVPVSSPPVSLAPTVAAVSTSYLVSPTEPQAETPLQSLSATVEPLEPPSQAPEVSKQGNSSNNIKEIESQQKNTNSSVKGVTEKCFRSIKQLSLHIKEMNTKKHLCEEKIRLVKEEYNKKLEALEEEKKDIDNEINKAIFAMAEGKELLKEEELFVPVQQESPVAVNPNAVVSEAQPAITTIVPGNTTVAVTIPASIPVAPIAPSSIPVAAIAPANIPVPATNLDNISVTSTAPTNIVVARTAPASTTVTWLTQTIPVTTTTPVTIPTTCTSQNRNTERINVISDASLKNFGMKKASPKKLTQAPSQPRLTLIQPPMNHPHLQGKQILRTVRIVPVTSLASSCGSENFSSTFQPKTQILQYPASEAQSPPNAVVMPDQQHPVMTSSHTLCRTLPHPATHVAYRRPPVNQKVKSMQSSNAGSLPPGYKNILSPQAQQVQSAGHYIPRQLQQQTQQQQGQPQLLRLLQGPQQQQYQHHQQQQQAQLQSSSNNLAQQQRNPQHNMQQYQQVQGHLQNNSTYPQGQVVSGTYAVPVNSKSINVSNAEIGHTFTLGSPYQPQQQIPTASASANTNTNVQANPQVPPTANQPTSESLGTSSESEVVAPICVVCGLNGIFTCCNNVIYCSQTCQGNDWSVHVHKCTNTVTPDAS